MNRTRGARGKPVNLAMHEKRSNLGGVTNAECSTRAKEEDKYRGAFQSFSLARIVSLLACGIIFDVFSVPLMRIFLRNKN